MRVDFEVSGGEATFRHGKSDGERADDVRSAAAPFVGVKSDVDDGDWFSIAAQSLYSLKPGTALYYATRLGDERLCQKYAAGTVRPPAYFLRRLLRSKHGKQWLNAVMDGCTEDWWLAREQDRHDAEALRAFELSRLKENGK